MRKKWSRLPPSKKKKPSAEAHPSLNWRFQLATASQQDRRQRRDRSVTKQPEALFRKSWNNHRKLVELRCAQVVDISIETRRSRLAVQSLGQWGGWKTDWKRRRGREKRWIMLEIASLSSAAFWLRFWSSPSFPTATCVSSQITRATLKGRSADSRLFSLLFFRLEQHFHTLFEESLLPSCSLTKSNSHDVPIPHSKCGSSSCPDFNIPRRVLFIQFKLRPYMPTRFSLWTRFPP